MVSDGDGFLWVGNHPATDLCNTRPVIDGENVELLRCFADLVRWCRVAGVEVPAESERASRREAARTLTFARELRDQLRAALGSPPSPVGPLNELLAGEPSVLCVDHGVALWAPTPAAQLRLNLAVAVLDVFDHDRHLIRRCANSACVLMFLDTSKSRRRRWCDMLTCGNRAKVAAHYARLHP
jgi:predicted RNA-binding Zn ribbon-like protein